jgi:hypothetical protein
LLALICLCIVLLASQALAKPIEARKWIESRSEHFVIRSRIRQGRTETILKHLELLRATIKMITSVPDENIPKPKIIYVFGDYDDYIDEGYVEKVPEGPRHVYKDPKGFLVDDTGGTILTAIAPYGVELSYYHYWTGTLRAYTHFLYNNDRTRLLPTWYRYGMEQFLSGARVRLESFELGEPLYPVETRYQRSKLGRNRVPHLPWGINSVHSLLSLDALYYSTAGDMSRTQWQAFLAQSWTLVHYLMMDPVVAQSPNESLGRYLPLVYDANKDAVTAFETAFGIPASELPGRLYKYFVSDCCRVISVPVDELLPQFKPSTVTLSKEEISLGLAENALLLGDPDRAERWYSIALQNEALADEAREGLAAVSEFRAAANSP